MEPFWLIILARALDIKNLNLRANFTHEVVHLVLDTKRKQAYIATSIMSEDTTKDSIYASPMNTVGEFVFDQRVAEVFPDMIQRSVPGYMSTLATIGRLANRYACAHSHVYDLGCSLGAATMTMHENIHVEGVSMIAVDNSAPMLEKCRANLKNLASTPAIELRCEDIRETVIANASVVVLNFTLQFVPIDERLSLLQKIHAGMQSGAVLILSEKVCFDNPDTQELLSSLHHDFKRLQGYTDLEIAQKRNALENILVPESIQAHKDRLNQAGFARSEVWLQCLNFASFIAFA